MARRPDPFGGAWVRRDQVSGALRVGGELDLATAPAVQAELTVLLWASADPVLVDLTEVTLLSAVGIEALQNVWTLARENGIELTMVTSAGGSAHRVLAILGMAIPDGTPRITASDATALVVHSLQASSEEPADRSASPGLS